MASENAALLAFNRGVISPLALGRVDLDRTRLSAIEQTNYIPRTLGSMMLRPGYEYISETKDSSAAIYMPFVYATEDTAFLEFTDQKMRVHVDEAALTRPSVSSSITNGTFTSDVTGWTDNSTGAGSRAWAMGGYLELTGTGFDYGSVYQEVTVSGPDTGVKHGVTIVVERGPVLVNIGLSIGDTTYGSVTLETGVHKIGLEPSANFFIEIKNQKSYPVLVDSVSIDSSGTMEWDTPWTESDLANLRWDTSGNVFYVACDGFKQRKIERRGDTSWSVEEYSPKDGPYRAINTTGISLTPSALSGEITLTASDNFFKSTNVGSLFRINSIGQTVTLSASGADQWSDAIRVTGVDASRIFDISIDTTTGSFTGTITIQKSVDEEGDWSDVPNLSYTTDTTTTHDDDLNNQIIYYRIGVKTGDYTGGTAELELSFGSGSNSGDVLVTKYTNATTVTAVVLDNLGGLDSSTNWYEGEWSDRRGFPTAVAFHDGRLAWAGRSKIILSVSDAFESFDRDIEGDSGVINRSLGKGPIDGVNWLFAGNRLIVGTDGLEASIRSSSFDEPLTPTAFSVKYPSTQGSANIPAAQVDQTGIFVQRGGTSIYRMVYSESTSYDYTSNEVTTLAPEITEPSIVRLAAQRQPDTRIHAVRSDGKVAVWLNDPAENVSCWVLVETDGQVEDVFVLPDSSSEDRVYYLVKRRIDGNDVRYLEKWALEADAQGGTLNKNVDSFITYSGVSTTSITGLDHLEGEIVHVWGGGAVIDAAATVTDSTISGLTGYEDTPVVVRNVADDDDYGIYTVDGDGNIEGLLGLDNQTVVVRDTGKDLGSYTVASGAITLSEATTDCVVGLYYKARFKSVKLAYAAAKGTALLQRKRLDKLGLLLRNTYKNNVKYGKSFTELDDLPEQEGGADVDDDALWAEYDEDMFEFSDDYGTDSRICLQSESPAPATVLAIVFGIDTNDKGL